MFSQTDKFSRWMQVEKAFLKFMCLRVGMGEERIKDALLACEINPFSFLKGMGPMENEHEVFNRVMRNASPLFKDPYFGRGLNHRSIFHTANALLIREWMETMFGQFREAKVVLDRLAEEYRRILQVGRTHGVWGEPTSFGYRFAVMYSDINRYMETLSGMRRNIEVITLDYGDLMNSRMGWELHSFLSRELELFVGERDGGKYGIFMVVVNGFVQEMSKHAMDICLMGEKDVGELEFDVDVRGFLEEVEILARRVNSMVERYGDMKVSMYGDTVGRFKGIEECLFGVMEGALGVIGRIIYVVQGISVNGERLERNLEMGRNVIFSQRALLSLVRNTKEDRRVLAEEIRGLSMQVRRGGVAFKALLAGSRYGRELSSKDLNQIFDVEGFLENIDCVYGRIFSRDNGVRMLKRVVWNQEEVSYVVDRLANLLDLEYGGEKIPVVFLAFAERALLLAGQLALKVRFPVILEIIPPLGGIEVGSIVQGRRVVMVEWLVREKMDVGGLGSECVDVKVCSLMKFMGVEDVDWCGFECERDDYYAGFGSTCGSSDSLRQLPVIGLAI